MVTQTNEAQIRALIDAQTDAIRNKDVAGAQALAATSIVRYDLAPPLQCKGSQALDEAGLQSWFDSFKGPIGLEIRDLVVTNDGDTAFCYGLAHMQGARTDGSETDLWFRQTTCLQRKGDRWQIVHEHASVPFYMDGSFRAAVDLTP